MNRHNVCQVLSRRSHKYQRMSILLDRSNLVGADLNPTADHLALNLYWQALTQVPHAYTVFVHVLDGHGNLIAQQDNMPVHDQLLTSCWLPGEQVTDPYSLASARRWTATSSG